MNDEYSLLINYYTGKIEKQAFLEQLYLNPVLIKQPEEEKQIGTHTGYENFFLYLMDEQEEQKSIFYDKVVIPYIKKFLEKKNITTGDAFYLSHYEYIWIAEQLKYSEFDSLFEINTNEARLFQKKAELTNTFIEWDHVILQYFGKNTPVHKACEDLEGFGTLNNTVEKELEKRNISSLTFLCSINEDFMNIYPDMESQIKDFNPFNYLGKFHVEYPL